MVPDNHQLHCVPGTVVQQIKRPFQALYLLRIRLTVSQSSCRTWMKCHYNNQLKANDSEVSAYILRTICTEQQTNWFHYIGPLYRQIISKSWLMASCSWLSADGDRVKNSPLCDPVGSDTIRWPLKCVDLQQHSMMGHQMLMRLWCSMAHMWIFRSKDQLWNRYSHTAPGASSWALSR